MSERLTIHQLRGELERRERYWKDWNGRAANKMARLEGENKDLQERVEELLDTNRAAYNMLGKMIVAWNNYQDCSAVIDDAEKLWEGREL